MRDPGRHEGQIAGGGSAKVRSARKREATTGSRVHSHGGFLDGQMLVAMPGMSDERFARSVIYLCAHSDEGAMGIVINRAASTIKFHDLLVQLEVIKKDEAILLPGKTGATPVLKGGPVETGRGFVLHSSDFAIDNSTLEIDGGVSLTATIDILRAIADGSGPSRAVLALGYAGWQAGQLEAEMQGNGWLNVPADPALIFDTALDLKYERAISRLGIDLSRLSLEAGHA
jgi:putative transcriptional regulator